MGRRRILAARAALWATELLVLPVLASCAGIGPTAGSPGDPVRGRGELVFPEGLSRPPLPFVAQGQEPAWNVRVEDHRMQIATDYGAQTFVLARVGSEQLGRETRLRAVDGERRAVLRAVRRLCRDSMSGMPHPYEATLVLAERTLRGCGGDPRDLLAGRLFRVEALEGDALLAGSQISLAFDREGRVRGFASCNRFVADYELGGEGLHIGAASSTRRACARQRMRQEQSFLALLAAVDRFDFDETGALVLHAGTARIVARADPDAGAQE